MLRSRVAILRALCVTPCLALSLRAQMFGTPTLQNAFSNPGVTVGADVGSGEHADTFGAAAAWSPSSARLQLSVGAALLAIDGGGNHATWGARVMAPVPSVGGPAWGVAGFVGLGGASLDGATEFRVPIGASLGYRRAIGANRGISGYVAPFYSWSRRSGDGTAVSAGRARVAFGIDLAVAVPFGVTVGYETGQSAKHGDPGPSGGIFGLGVSYALRLH